MSSRKVLAPYNEQARIATYEVALRAVGLEPFAADTAGSLSLEGMAGLLLTGGTDVSPRLYGEVPRPETEESDDRRDAVEQNLIREALERDLPVFAICRGMQMLNVAQGGSLIQHLPTHDRHVRRTADRSLPAHTVRVEPGTLLSDITGEQTLQVNSRHHQAVGRLGDGLVISARASEDGVIEGIEQPGKRFVVAVQWHPEDQVLTDPMQLRLFERFAAALS